MALEDLIEKLPIEYQQWARHYGDAILGMGYNELLAWTDLILKGNYSGAYKELAQKMTTEQLLASQEHINNMLKQANKRNATIIAMQKQAVIDAMTIGLMLLKSKI